MSMEVVEVDGSYGEGGGQILRVASAFSVIFRRPIHVKNIRAGRKNPGLRPQHLSALKILASLTSAKLEGAYVGSTEIYFQPSDFGTQRIEWDLGTAGSITLVLQTLIPAVSISGKYLELSITGGTDVPWSPTSDYFDIVVRKAFESIGIKFEMSILRRGYYPKGGGKVNARIFPSSGLKPLFVGGEPEYSDVRIISRCGSLPKEVAERQANSALSILTENKLNVSEVIVSQEVSFSPGTSILVYCCSGGCYVGSDSIGERGVRAEVIGSKAAKRFLDKFTSNSNIDQNLSDMLSPILSLADGISQFYVSEITNHLKTSVYVAKLFKKFEFSYTKEGDRYLVKIYH
jgi:RNA 3'-phosphate cyclase